MKKLIIAIIFILIPCLAGAGILEVIARKRVAGGGGVDPDWYSLCADDAANSTVTAVFGASGSTYESGVGYINTSTVYTSDGGGSFHLNSDDAHDTQVIITGALLDTAFNDNAFAIQWDMKSSTSFSGNSERLFTNDSSETQLMATTTSDTSFDLYIGTTYYGSLSVDDMATGGWLTYRAVINNGAANRVEVYQGSDEANLSLKDSSTTSSTTMTLPNNFALYLGGNIAANKTRNAQYRNLKIWYTAETP